MRDLEILEADLRLERALEKEPDAESDDGWAIEQCKLTNAADNTSLDLLFFKSIHAPKLDGKRSGIPVKSVPKSKKEYSAMSDILTS